MTGIRIAICPNSYRNPEQCTLQALLPQNILSDNQNEKGLIDRSAVVLIYQREREGRKLVFNADNDISDSFYFISFFPSSPANEGSHQYL